MMNQPEQPEGVAGERAMPAVDRAARTRGGLGNVFALGLMLMLGLGALTWYYAHAFSRNERVKAAATAAAQQRAQGEMPLPGLGKIAPPDAAANVSPREPTLPAADAFTAMPDLTVARPLAEIPVVQSEAPAGAAPLKTKAQLALERQLSGAVYASQTVALAGAVPGSATAEPGPGAAPPLRALSATGADAAVAGASPAGGLMSWSESRTAARAMALPAQRLLLPKGAFIDCTLETAIDSTLPGMTTCVMATDSFGMDGQVVLMERGTRLIGETRGQVQQGAARIFVLWTEARTPTGLVVPLDSPGADALGRAGLPGEVNRHFWQRFGAAMLVSVVDGAVQAAAQSSRSSTVVVNPAASSEVLTEILKNTVGIAPTVVKRNGDRISVLVARDVDFRSVYELRTAHPR